MPIGRLSMPLAASIGFVPAVLSIALVAVLCYRTLHERGIAAAQVTHTLDVLETLSATLSLVTDAESGQRGYLLTKDSNYLAPYSRASSELEPKLHELKQALAGRPSEVAHFNQIERLVHDKLRELTAAIELGRSGKFDEAMRIVDGNAGRAMIDQLHTVEAQIEAEERRLLYEWDAEQTRVKTFSSEVALAGLAVLLALITGAMLVTNREFRIRIEQAWLRKAQADLSEQIMAANTSAEVAERGLRAVAEWLDAPVGALYLRESDGVLHRTSSYAGVPHCASIVGLGEGLVGQTYLDDRVWEVTDVPDNYISVQSSIGRCAPLALALAPIRAERTVVGVVELGRFRRLQPIEKDYLEVMSELLGAAVAGAQYRRQLEELLDETQRQAKELQSQQEALRTSNQELEEQGRALRESQERLEKQQAELEESNAQLEEQTQLLELQKHALEQTQHALQTKNEALERTSQYKSEFLANMSHELRTPLNSTLILARLLADNREGSLNQEQVHFAETIYSASNDLLTLINDILDLSKIEAGRIEPHPESVVVAQIAGSLRDTFLPMARERQLEFSVEIDPRVPVAIETDRFRLDQILKNLLSNAFKFTERGSINLRFLELDAERVAIIVKDTGIGIPPSYHQTVFEAFRQVESTSSRKYGGTGLGLSISRDLARLLGGEIQLDSGLGKGSTFTLLLPKLFRKTEPNWAEPALTRVSAWKRAPRSSNVVREGEVVGEPGRRILIIEDDARFASILSDLSRELEFDPIVATKADEGFNIALTEAPTAIVLDIGLPDHSGLTVLDRLKRNSRTRHIPVHVVSAFDHAQTAREMGAASYALKPVNRDELSATLQALASKASQRRRRLLVVEDDERQREGIRRLLTGEDIEVISVAFAKEALEALRRSTFDCMVVDINLPDASGYELLETMAHDDAYTFPPAIVYTGCDLNQIEEDRLRRYSQSIIIKGARSPERLFDEVTLFLHQVESRLTPERQRMLREARSREALFEKRCILVVEDDVRNIFAMSRLLEPRGASIEIARNGCEALERLSRPPKIDLVLMDVMMPEMDGLEATRRIRERAEWQKLPIIMITAKAMPDDQERCLEAGANDYVAKPIDVDKLLSLIRVWMPK